MTVFRVLKFKRAKSFSNGLVNSNDKLMVVINLNIIEDNKIYWLNFKIEFEL